MLVLYCNRGGVSPRFGFDFDEKRGNILNEFKLYFNPGCFHALLIIQCGKHTQPSLAFTRSKAKSDCSTYA